MAVIAIQGPLQRLLELNQEVVIENRVVGGIPNHQEDIRRNSYYELYPLFMTSMGQNTKQKQSYDYEQYLTELESVRYACPIVKENLILQIVERYHPKKDFQIWTDSDDDTQLIIKVNVNEEGKVHINELPIVDTTPLFQEKFIEGIFTSDHTVNWWNLCYSIHPDGTITYDTYYDELYASNDSELTMLFAREKLQQVLRNIPFSTCTTFIVGKAAKLHALAYELERILKEPAKRIEQTWLSYEKMTQLRHLYYEPLGEGQELKLHYTHLSATECSKLTNGSEFILTLPLSSELLQQTFLGNHSYSELIAGNDPKADLAEAGTKFLISSIKVSIDIFGNTVLTSHSNANGTKKCLLRSQIIQ